jgi:predicted  nucleic acid-binding Zn-ribbon protein
VSVEWFSKLKEYDSLSRMRINHLKLKQEQEDRVSKIQQRQEQAHLQSVKLNHLHHEYQQKLFELEKQIKTAAEQKQRLIDFGSDASKIKDMDSQLSMLEDQGLTLLEHIETQQQESDENRVFLHGLEKTLQEIRTEVATEVAQHEQEIKSLDLRLSLLMEALPENFQQLLKIVLSKNLAHGPFTKNESGSCYFCRYKISKIDESEIDVQFKLKTCSQCGRIFLPYGL